jgi:hypothetical protein
MPKKNIDTLSRRELLELPDNEKKRAGYRKSSVVNPEVASLPVDTYKVIDIFNNLPGIANRSSEEREAIMTQIDELDNHLKETYGEETKDRIFHFAAVQSFIDQGIFPKGSLEVWIKDNKSPIQQELFPLFQLQKSVELKKQFSLNFGGLERIKKEHKKLLSHKLSSGLTLQQHIEKVENWFNNLHGENLGNWIKLFAYVKSVKEFSDTHNGEESVSFRAIGPGRYCFSIKQNKEFFSYFIRPDAVKKDGTKYHSTKAKDKFLKWLYDNQDTINFPMILNGEVWNVPMKIYSYTENVETKQILFYVDTNILESEFKDYVSINIDEIDGISDAWETIATANQDFANLRLNRFLDIPLKFYLTLKNTYNRKTDYKNKKYAGNVQRLSRETLDVHLGKLSERIEGHLKKRGKIRTGETSGKPQEIKRLILETAFTIAVQRKWLVQMPGYDEEKELYIFNINAGHFDGAHTAIRLKAIES